MSLYSPETCIFVAQNINKLLNDHGSARGQYVVGVCKNNKDGKYFAFCSNNGKQQYLGIYLTEEEAHLVYIKFKKELIIITANQQSDRKLKEALLKIAQEEYLV